MIFYISHKISIKYHTGSSVPTAVLLYNCVHCILVQGSALADIAAVPAPLNHLHSGLQNTTDWVTTSVHRGKLVH